MISKDLVEHLIFNRYTDNTGNIIYVMITGSNYKFPIELHRMEKKLCNFKDIFGEIK